MEFFKLEKRKKPLCFSPCCPAILLLGIYPREMKTYPHKDLYLDAHSNIIENTKVGINSNVIQQEKAFK